MRPIFISSMKDNKDIMKDYLEDWPAVNTKNNRILGMILNFNNGHIDPMSLIINEYVTMCEHGWRY